MVLPAGQEQNLPPVETQQFESQSSGQSRKVVITEIWKLSNELRALDLEKRMAEIGIEFNSQGAQQKYDQAVTTLQNTMAKTTLLAQSLHQCSIAEKPVVFHSAKQAIELSRDELLAEAQSFMINKLKKANVSEDVDLPPTILEFIEHTLQRTQGITIGESHDDAVMLFIISQMTELKKIGISTIFLEGLRYNLQKEIDDENWGKIESDEAFINKMIKECIILAHQEGIRVIGLESKNMTSFDGNDRLICFNYMASKIINEEEAKGKFIALVGASHGTSLYNGAISGISELTGSSCIEIYGYENKSKKVTTMLHSRFGETRKKPAVFKLTEKM